MSSIINKIRQELKRIGDEKIKKSAQRFFKETIKFYGVKNPVAEKIGKERFQSIKDRKKTDIFDLCEELWRSGYMEESIIACHWSYYVRKEYEPKDFKIFEKWVQTYVDNWASCDTLCNHTVGAFVEMYPDHVSKLKTWALSKNRWMRRAASVSLIVPAKQGEFLKDILEIADTLLLDNDDLVQKGYGWMLKAAANNHQKEIFGFIIKNKSIMPRTALRYAIEKMPPELKVKAMGAFTPAPSS
jgi:3-methyladenine DNA glycosylase AlkD